MAASVEDFVEILDVESGVDLPKLREAARHGIPEPVYILNFYKKMCVLNSFQNIDSSRRLEGAFGR